MEKIMVKLFDRRRNQKIWFHFCYLPDFVWEKYHTKYPAKLNLDAEIKEWIKQDFDVEMEYVDDIYEAKERIKDKYSATYPAVFLKSESDRQGWSRVWLTEKINNLLEENNE